MRDAPAPHSGFLFFACAKKRNQKKARPLVGAGFAGSLAPRLPQGVRIRRIPLSRVALFAADELASARSGEGEAGIHGSPVDFHAAERVRRDSAHPGHEGAVARSGACFLLVTSLCTSKEKSPWVGGGASQIQITRAKPARQNRVQGRSRPQLAFHSAGGGTTDNM